MTNMEKLAASPRVRDQNVRMAIAAMTSIHHDDLPSVMCALLGKYKRMQLDMALDTAQRMLGQSPTMGQVPVRVCAISDSVCYKQCGNGPCKRETT